MAISGISDVSSLGGEGITDLMRRSLRRLRRRIRCRRRYGKECPHGVGKCRRNAIHVTAPSRVTADKP